MNRDEIRRLNDDQLNRAIAERSGCRLEVSDAGRFRVLDLQGEPVSPTWHQDEDEAWRYALLPDRVPDWARSVREAFVALMDVARQLEVTVCCWSTSEKTFVYLRPFGLETAWPVMAHERASRALAEQLLIALDGGQ
jgi:hypothetical protein